MTCVGVGGGEGEGGCGGVGGWMMMKEEKLTGTLTVLYH